MNSLPLLIVRCAEVWLALPIGDVLEVVRMVAPASALPRVPRYCIGAADYHGQLVPMIDLAARLGLCAPRRPSELIDARMVILSEHAEALLSEGAEDAQQTAETGGDALTGLDLSAFLQLPLSMLALVVDDVSELCEREIIPLSPADQAGYGGMWRGSVKWQEEKSALVFDVPMQHIVTMRAGRALRQALYDARRQGLDVQGAVSQPEDSR